MRKTRFMAVFLAVVMLLGTMPAALAVSAGKPRSVTFSDQGNIELGKTSGGLNGNWETQISLTVQSIQNQSPVAVEFVLDGTESLYMDMNRGEYESAIVSVAEQARKLLYNKNAKMGITVFGREAWVATPMGDVPAASDATLYADTIVKLSEDGMRGTNIQAGIKTGLSELAKADVPTANKYLVLITDGGSYWWNDETTGALQNNCFTTSAGGAKNYLHNTDAAEGGFGLASLADLRAAAKANPQSMKEYQFDGDGDAMMNAMAAISQSRTTSDKIYTSFEKGVCHAAEAVDAVEAAGVNLVVISRPYYEGHAGLSELSDLAGDFIDYANGKTNGLNYSLSETNITTAIQQITKATTIRVRAGSTITDWLGDSKYDDDKNRTDGDAAYNYNLVDSVTPILNIGGKNVALVKRDGNTWYYADGSTLVWSGTGDKENIKLTLGRDLAVNEKLILTYTAVLNERDTDKGDHKTYTNVEACLTPVNTTDHLMFPEPAEAYRIGGGTNPDVIITPQPIPGGDKPELNTSDHYAYIIGRKDGLVHPEDQITRAEVATIFFRMLTDESRNELWSQSNPYSDVAPDMWCNAAISTMTRAGVIEGFKDGTFRPYAPITRAQFAAIAVRFFEVTYAGDDKFSDIAGHWAADYINKAAEAAIIAGFQDGTFRPNNNITRAQAMTIFNRVLGRAPEKDHLLPDMITWPDNLNTSAWYYATMQEATNSHEYEKTVSADGSVYEVWTKMLPVRDWAAFEKEWSDSNSAANPGEVISVLVLGD